MPIYFIRESLAAKALARRRAESVRPASASQTRERVDRGPVMEWAAVIFQLFSLSLFSGTFLLLFVWALKLWTAN
jgi:hypothetical protein